MFGQFLFTYKFSRTPMSFRNLLQPIFCHHFLVLYLAHFVPFRCYRRLPASCIFKFNSASIVRTYLYFSRRSDFLDKFSPVMRFSCGVMWRVNEFCTLQNVPSEKITDNGGTDANEVYKIVVDYSNPELKMEEALDHAGVKLTTPLVMQVLHKLRYEEKLAFRFFTWAGHQENYSHEPQAYNEMIGILSSTKYKVKQFRIVCDLLDYMKRKDKSSVPIEVLLNVLRQYTEKHLIELQKFAKKKKIRVKTQPEVNAFNLLLDALCKCCLVEDAEAMLRRVQCKIKPNADTYNTLFFGWCRVRNPSRGIAILEEMIKMGLEPDNFTYNTAIDTFCQAGMVTEAAEFLEFMRAKGSTTSSPTAKSYSIMIVALVQTDRMEECFKLIGEMINSGCLPDVSTYRDIIEGMCSSPRYRHLQLFLKVLCDNKDKDEARRLYKRMIDVAFDTWHEMDRRCCMRDIDTYCVMIEGLFASKNTQHASYLLEEVIHRGMKLPYRKFDSFLMHLSALGDLQAINRLSEHMRKFYNPAMARRFALNQKRKSMSVYCCFAKGKLIQILFHALLCTLRPLLVSTRRTPLQAIEMLAPSVFRKLFRTDPDYLVIGRISERGG
ncbi:hypothetical protein M9H77_30869 [Catharanthus roseus]|uniref:Uncharacterized protein n=1 Tax=Catharanthus roseus TaxID=4058 RepID=A0ACB9ZYH4_CATRO|nr:hypothetical protein M9H77_30869 [Catharanthus roseus]